MADLNFDTVRSQNPRKQIKAYAFIGRVHLHVRTCIYYCEFLVYFFSFFLSLFVLVVRETNYRTIFDPHGEIRTWRRFSSARLARGRIPRAGARRSDADAASRISCPLAGCSSIIIKLHLQCFGIELFAYLDEHTKQCSRHKLHAMIINSCERGLQ